MLVRSERHLIKKSNPNWIVCDDFCFKAKNLYNTCLYIIFHAYKWRREGKEDSRERIIDFADLVNDKGYIRKFDLIKRFTKLKHSDYYAMSTQSSQQVIANVYDILDSTFKAIKSKNINHKVSFPRYKHKSKGRFVCTFTNQNTKIIDGEIYYKYPKKKSLPKYGFHGIKVQHPNYQTVSIVPNVDGTYTLVVSYKVEKCEKRGIGNTFSIDLGVNTLMAVTSDKGGYRPVLVNGRPLKSLNRYYHVLYDKAQSQLPRGKKQRYISKKIYSLNRKRSSKINDYMHKASRWLINEAIENNVSTIIIGYNKNQKNKNKMHGKSKQDFIEIPRRKLVQMIEYKAEEQGIEVICVDEAYTSKCSALDYETICWHDSYCGVRDKKYCKRFTTKNGIVINADVNASLNIMRIVNGDGFLSSLDIGCVLQPRKLTINDQNVPKVMLKEIK